MWKRFLESLFFVEAIRRRVQKAKGELMSLIEFMEHIELIMTWGKNYSEWRIKRMPMVGHWLISAVGVFYSDKETYLNDELRFPKILRRIWEVFLYLMNKKLPDEISKWIQQSESVQRFKF